MMKIVRITLTLLASLSLFSLTVIGQTSHSKLHVGKKGEIVLKEPTKIADTTLQPGTYVVQHRVISDRHYVRFQKLEENAMGGLNLEPTFEPTDAGVFACKLEPAASKFKTTAVFIDRGAQGGRIVKVEIKGEDASHIF
jgi:hypothetical protein